MSFKVYDGGNILKIKKNDKPCDKMISKAQSKVLEWWLIYMFCCNYHLYFTKNRIILLKL